MNGINPYGSFFLNLMGQGNSLSQTGQIISTTQDLKALAVSTILKGEVSARAQNGTNVITTPRGDVTVKLNNPLPIGAKVEIQLPPSDTPKQDVLIRPSLAQAIAQQQTPAPESTIQNSVNQQAQTAVKQPNIFEDVQTLQGTKQAAALKTSEGTNIPQPPLQIGQAVRLTPLPITQQSLSALIRLFAPIPAPTQILVSNVSPRIFTPQIQWPIAQTPTSALTVPQISIPIIPQPSFLPGDVQTPILTNSEGVLSKTVTLQPVQTKNFYPAGQPPSVTLAPAIVRGDSAPDSSNRISTPTNAINIPQIPAALKSGDAQVYRITPAPPTINQSGQAPLPSTEQTPLGQNMTQPQQSRLPVQTITQSPAFAGQIAATVTGFITAEGNPIIQLASPIPTGNSHYVVMNYPAKNLPAGTQVTLTPMPSVGIRPSLSVAPSPQLPWPAMNDFLQQALAFPATAQHILNSLPMATQAKQFPAAALLFLAAAKNGDLSGWLGQRPLRMIEGGQHDTLQKMLRTILSDLPSMIGKTATQTDPPLVQQSPEWRGYILPLLGGTHPDQATLWVKDDGHNNGEQDREKHKSIRFLVDLTLTRMGTVQFDGFINTDKKQFDLTLLTERAFGTETQGQIRSVWLKTLDGLGLGGNINFKENL